MAHSVRSPLFQALEILIQEQVGRDRDCPEGAGILRAAGSRGACRDPQSGLEVTGSGGALWCVNCHAPGGGGPAPDILVAGGAGASLTPEEFKPFIRGGEEHQPGPYRTSDFSDRQLNDLLAYILAQSSS